MIKPKDTWHTDVKNHCVTRIKDGHKSLIVYKWWDDSRKRWWYGVDEEYIVEQRILIWSKE